MKIDMQGAIANADAVDADKRVTDLRIVKLGELITKRRTELGLSRERLAVRARDRGYHLTRTTLSAFENHPLPESPRRVTMEALAVALGVPYRTIVLAVADSMSGEDGALSEVTAAQHVESWITITQGRSDAEIARMLRVVESVADAIDQTADQAADRPSPN